MKVDRKVKSSVVVRMPDVEAAKLIGSLSRTLGVLTAEQADLLGRDYTLNTLILLRDSLVSAMSESDDS